MSEPYLKSNVVKPTPLNNVASLSIGLISDYPYTEKFN